MNRLRALPLDRAAKYVRDADPIICSGNYPISNVVARVTKSPYTHVGFATWNKGKLCILHAEENYRGVVEHPLEDFMSDYRGCMAVTRLRGIDPAATLACARIHLGKPYSRKTLIYGGLFYVLRWKMLERIMLERTVATDAFACTQLFNLAAGLIFPIVPAPVQITQLPSIHFLCGLKR